MMIRARYTKTGHMRFLSHLDLVRLFERAFRRADLPLAFTQGFNPHPIISFAAPLSVGVGSIAEYVDVQLAKPMAPITFVKIMNDHLPPGIVIMHAAITDHKTTGSLMQEAALMEYHIIFRPEKTIEISELQNCHRQFMELEVIYIEKKQKQKNKQRHRRNAIKVKQIDILPYLHQFTLDTCETDTVPDQLCLRLAIYVTENGTVKPGLILDRWLEYCNINIEADSLLIERREIYRKTATGFEPILPV